MVLVPQTQAQEPSKLDQEMRLQLMRLVTQYDPVEGGGSYGDGAGNMGLGLQSFQAINPRDLNQTLTSTESAGSSQQVFPKLTLLRGLRYPLDFGFQFGSFAKGPGMLGAHMQYTWFDEFRWPTIGIRAHYSQLTGSPDLDMKQSGIGIFASYGPFYWLQAYVGYAVQQAHYKITERNENSSSALPQPRSSVSERGFEKSQQLYYGIHSKFGASPYSLSMGENIVLANSSSSASPPRSLQIKAAYGF